MPDKFEDGTFKPVKQNHLKKKGPCLNEIPPHSIHEITTKGHEAIDVNLFPCTSMRFSCQKG